MSSDKKVFIITNGCPENRIDTARIQEFFVKNEYTITDKLQDADTIIFNACAHTQDFENLSIEIIKDINLKKKPSAELIVCGCLTKINKERLRMVHQGTVFGPDESRRLDEIFRLKVSFRCVCANSLINLTKSLSRCRWFIANLKEKGFMTCVLKLIEKRRSEAISVCRPDAFYIKISSGCLGNCTFCAIRLSRGVLKSKPVEDIIREFDRGLRDSYKNFALIGTEVGAYGKDIGTDLVHMLKELVSREGDYKIRLRNLHPKFLIEILPEMRDIFKSGKISFLSCAVESGNNRILKLMNRGYIIEDFKKAIRMLNEEFPEIQIRTQVMVGFPTETEKEFEDTVKLISELYFDFVEIYLFQPRPGTAAANMQGKVSEKIARRRYLKLTATALFNKWLRKK